MKRTNLLLLTVILIPLLCLSLVALYYLPPLHERLVWRVDETILRVKYWLYPPQEAVFVPLEGTQADSTVPATIIGQLASTTSATVSETPAVTETLTPTLSQTQAVTVANPTSTIAPSPTSPPLPDNITLTGVRYDDQHGRYNYCAPANLSMALSFWGWQGNKDTLGPVLKPDPKDKNVMPYEMADYVRSHTELSVVERVGGDLSLLKRLLSAGYPVLVEKGTYLRDLTGVVSWMGHYQVITGYDDPTGYFIAQDSYIQPDHKVPYEEMITNWRAFNYTYMLIYPSESEPEIQTLLGADWDETANYQNAALIASNEIYGLSGIDQYFAWFNRGTNLMKLQDYAGAAQAYDEAFAVYPTIPENERPWRMLWYQTGPYFAYFYSQRYYDVLYLADGTLNAMQGDRNLEESYYWRGMAKNALGDTQGAIQDFRTCLEYHEGFEPAVYQLNLLGATP
jgi:hypothetical protein